MTSRHRGYAMFAGGVIAAAGLAASAQQAQPERDQGQQREARQGEAQAGQRVAVLRLHRAKSLMDADVNGPGGDTVASVEDMIFERGSGRLTHVVLGAGGVIGIGETKVAVPFSELQYDEAEDAFTTTMTEEELKNATEFDPEAWESLDHGDEGWGRTEAGEQDDPYADTIRSSQPEEIRGTVRSLERVMGSGDGEHVVLTIEAEQGESKTVLLGPSWYMVGQEGLPYRGENASFRVYPLGDEAPADYIAVKSTDASRDLRIRDEQNRPTWMDGRAGGDAQAATDPQRGRRLMLMSDLVGADVTLPDREETGEVQDVVVDVERGRILILGLDPNENFLGIGDDVKCVPWPAARIVDSETVRVDADVDTLTECDPLPDDVTVLATPARMESVYGDFDVRYSPDGGAAADRPWREEGRQEGRDIDDQAGGMSDEAVHALADGEETEISGTVESVSTRMVQGFPSPMVVATVSAGDGVRTVVLGPESHFRHDPVDLRRGEEVRIEAMEAQVGGREIVAARTIHAGGREIKLWEGDKPLWKKD